MNLLSRMRGVTREGGRFLIAGVTNTACTFALYWLALPAVGYALAYTMSFTAGIVLSYLLHSIFVFRTGTSLRSAVLFPSVYLVQYLIGLVVLWVWTSLLHLPAEYGVFVTVTVSLPAVFLLSKYIIRRR